jgi:hypothetical protein
VKLNIVTMTAYGGRAAYLMVNRKQSTAGAGRGQRKIAPKDTP